MNQSIDPHVMRCCVSDATRSEYGGTRKYAGVDVARVQTAAAFVGLMKELGEDSLCVSELQAGLVGYTEAFDRQLRWSGMPEPRITLPRTTGTEATTGAERPLPVVVAAALPVDASGLETAH